MTRRNIFNNSDDSLMLSLLNKHTKGCMISESNLVLLMRSTSSPDELVEADFSEQGSIFEYIGIVGGYSSGKDLIDTFTRKVTHAIANVPSDSVTNITVSVDEDKDISIRTSFNKPYTSGQIQDIKCKHRKKVEVYEKRELIMDEYFAIKEDESILTKQLQIDKLKEEITKLQDELTLRPSDSID